MFLCLLDGHGSGARGCERRAPGPDEGPDLQGERAGTVLLTYIIHLFVVLHIFIRRSDNFPGTIIKAGILGLF